MQYRFFMIPAMDGSESENDLNAFVRSRRILSVQKEFVSEGKNSYWAVVVEYLEGKQPQGRLPGAEKTKVDYKEILDEQQFVLFSSLRNLRKEIADAEGLPVYVVFTNEQLAEMVRLKVASKADMGKIDGVGEGKLDKYADRFLSALVGAQG
jgi:superfamily II DNA helicase RecQ